MLGPASGNLIIELQLLDALRPEAMDVAASVTSA